MLISISIMKLFHWCGNEHDADLDTDCDIDIDTDHDTHIYTIHEADTYQLMWSDHDNNIDTENENWYWYQYNDIVICSNVDIGHNAYIYIDHEAFPLMW